MLTPLLVICSASMLTAGPPQLIFKILSGCQWLNSYILETIIKNFLAFPFPYSVSITVQSSSASCLHHVDRPPCVDPAAGVRYGCMKLAQGKPVSVYTRPEKKKT